MSSNDFDPSQGTSLEELRQYADVLLGAAELADALESQPLRASDVFYRVSNPLIVDLVTVPEDVRYIIGHHDLKSVAFWVQNAFRDQDEPEGRVVVESAVILEFSDDTDVHLKLIDGEAWALFQDEEEHSVRIPAKDVSDILARLTHPSNDPDFSDFHDFNNPDIADEICETLKNEDFITTSIERTYEIEGYQVITQFQNDLLNACIITDEKAEGDFSLALEVEFSNFKTATKLYKLTDEGEKEQVLEPELLERYMDIIKRLKDRITPDETPDSSLR